MIKTDNCEFTGASLVDALSAWVPGIITLIGGGGKTSMMYYLADKLVKRGIKTLATTTTKLYKPESRLLLADTLTACRQAINNAKLNDNFSILAQNISVDNPRKIMGLNPAWISILAQEFANISFIVEGDGSAGKSLKGHLTYEPVIPENCRLVIPVMGIDVIGQPLNSRQVHRAMRAAQIAGVQENAIITTELMARLLLCRDGYLHNCPEKAVVLPFINKADCPERWRQAKKLSGAIMKLQDERITGVLVGSMINEKFNMVIRK